MFCKALFVTQNYQFLKFLLLLYLPFQFLRQIAVIFLFRFLQSLNLMIQNLLVCLLKSHLLPVSIKSSRRLFKSSTQACQSNFFQNQKVFSFVSLFQVRESPIQRNAAATLPFTIIPLRSSAICIFLLNLLLTRSSHFILNFNILTY